MASFTSCRFAMNFLLFLTVLWMQHNYCSAGCNYVEELSFPTNHGACLMNEQCKSYKKASNASKIYEFLGTGVSCKLSEGSGECCMSKTICQTAENKESEVLATTTTGNVGKLPVMCKTHEDCKRDDNVKEYVCQADVCCSKPEGNISIACLLGKNEDSTKQGCNSIGDCDSGKHCSPTGCCKNHPCEGSPLLPQFDVTLEGKLQFLECSSMETCSHNFPKYPDTYCSKITGGSEKKFCCPVPYSKTFMNNNGRYLLPTKILEHHSIVRTPKTIGEALTAVQGNFSKECKTNSDCDDNEFCDDVVTRNSTHSEKLSKIGDYKPRMCFPAPRCAGKIVRDTELGIKTCNRPGECGPNEFCDTQTNDGSSTINAMQSLGVCCQYDCTAEAKGTKMAADESLTAYASYTANNAICNVNTDCGKNGLCVTAKESGTGNSLLPPPKQVKLCCKYAAKKESEVHRCHDGSKPLNATNGGILICGNDEDCNRVEGQATPNRTQWDYECVESSATTKHCCKADKCGDGFTYKKTELDCEEPEDCMKEQEDKSDAEHRAMCTEFVLGNKEQAKKKCCPIDNVNNRLAYCTRTKCSKMVDCKEGMYCHPKNNVCCYLGVKKLDGSAHEKGNTCQGTCPDADKFGTMVPQYCVREDSEEEGGRCYLSPYVRVKERSRTVNPVYKTVCIVCVVLTLVFAFLAVIMFVNYRSRNFCDKYRPKRKGKKGKKSKGGKKGKGTTGTESGTGTGTGTGADGASSTGGGGGTTGGTSGAGGTTGDGTSGAGDGTSGAGDGTSTGGTSGAGDGTSGTGA